MRINSFTASAIFYPLAALAFSSCAIDSNSVGPKKDRRILHQWHDDGGPGKVAIKISLTDQIAEFTRGGRDIGWCYVATGKEGHATKPGDYKITEKVEDKHSNSYGWMEDEFGNVTNGDAKPTDKVPKGMFYVAAPMPYWMRLTSYGIGMHGGLIPEPGQPASHGCIRMPKDFVSTLFAVVDVGTPVTITNAPSKRNSQPITPPASAPFEGEWRVIDSRPLTPAEAQTPLPPTRTRMISPNPFY